MNITRNCIVLLVALFSNAIGDCQIVAELSNRLQDVLVAESAKELGDDAVRFGDPILGASIFRKPEMNCSACHLKDSGRRLGPDLAKQRNVTPEHLVESLLHPSKTIHAGYETTMVLTVDGSSYAGILVAENDKELVLDQIEQAAKPIRIRLEDIEQRRLSDKSTMPEALVNQLSSRQQFLHLISYLFEISQGGHQRESELAPADSLFALPPLPEYEKHIDHRRLIASFNEERFERGREIFRLRCESCHGSVDEPGSLPTSLRFASGQFKHGHDPYTMYQTLTHGYGMMNAQRWMVPQQKYDVIHYIREHFLKDQNSSQYFKIGDDYLAALPSGDTFGPEPVENSPWSAMDYGPSLNHTIEVSNDRSNIAQKGIAIRLDSGPGGVESGDHWILYDHDLMRVAAIWSGDFIDYNGISFNGVHGRHPRITGSILMRNPVTAGWGNPTGGGFDDDRLVGRDGRKYGPLDKSWLRFNGIHRYENRSILNYEIGGTPILESPGLAYVGDTAVVSRNFVVGPRSNDLVLQVATVIAESDVEPADQKLLIFNEERDSNPAKDDTPAGTALSGGRYLQTKSSLPDDLLKNDFCIYAEIKTTEDGTIVAQTQQQAKWLPHGKTFFLRDGRLHFDIGWVGEVDSQLTVNDGRWNAVAMNYDAASEEVSFFARQKLHRPAGVLAADENLQPSVLRIGFTNDDFPNVSAFDGEIRNVQIFAFCLKEGELNNIGAIASKSVVNWQAGAKDSEFQLHSAGESSPKRESANLLVATSLEPNQFEWIHDESGNLRLRVLAGTAELRFSVSVADAPQPFARTPELAEQLEQVATGVDLKRFTAGGPPSWPQRLTTQIQTLEKTGPFAVDVLTRPELNPWNDRLRFTGVDFVDDRRVAIVCCWDGTVYRVEGLVDADELVWRRIASGLFQPLGVKVVDGKIYVCCRDQIVRLVDLNGDFETDFYENFNSDHQVTEHFHEFAMGLQTDEDGNFYYAKSARHALKAVVPHHGTLLKVDPNGSSTTIVANGFRAANGVCLNADGSFIVTDQEGHWNPKNRINWVRPGGFYGNMFGYHNVDDASDEAMDKPLCWITNAFDRSPAELLWVDSDAWGPLNGSLLNFSYGHGKIYIVPHEDVNGQKQGGMCALPLPEFPTGIMRGRFNAKDGQLYACGMFAWSGNRQQPGGFYRVRYSGEPVVLPVGIAATTDGIKISYSGKLDDRSVADLQNFRVRCWDLKRTANYGSKHYNERELQVIAADLSDDRRTLHLSIANLSPTRGMEIEYSLIDSAGKRVRGKIHNTIHQLSD